MNAKAIRLLLIPIIGVAAWFFFLRSGTTAGEMAPDFSITIRNGSEVSLSDLKGQYVLLDFWASWCGPCLKDIPKIKKLDQDYSEKTFGDAAGFEVFSIALEKNASRWEKALDKYDMNWKYTAVDESKFVRLSTIASSYGVTDIPHTVLIDPQGLILGVNLQDSEIRQILDKAR